MSGIAILRVVGFLLLAPIVGGLLSGVERIVRAQAQGGKVSSPIQPFRDILMLMKLQPINADKQMFVFVIAYMILSAISGAIFFFGSSLALIILLSVLAGMFYIVGIYSSKSAYAKNIIEGQILGLGIYLILFFLSAFGFYIVTAIYTGEGSFHVSEIVSIGGAPAYYLPGLLVGIIVFLSIVPRNCFLQDTVAAEYSGRNLVFLEVGRWYEIILLYSFLFLFNYGGTVITAIIAGVVCLLVYSLRLLMSMPYSKKISPIILYTIGFITIVLAFVNLAVILC
jgi:ech hydrogenase subunit B